MNRRGFIARAIGLVAGAAALPAVADEKIIPRKGGKRARLAVGPDHGMCCFGDAPIKREGEPCFDDWEDEIRYKVKGRPRARIDELSKLYAK